MTESRSVAWHPVALFVGELLAQANAVPPAAGTPAWRALDDADPRKLLAVAVAGVSAVIDWDDRQTAHAEASREISSAAPWPEIGRRIAQGRGNAYIPKKAS